MLPSSVVWRDNMAVSLHYLMPKNMNFTGRKRKRARAEGAGGMYVLWFENMATASENR